LVLATTSRNSQSGYFYLRAKAFLYPLDTKWVSDPVWTLRKEKIFKRARNWYRMPDGQPGL